jgi:hypothetical protein
LNCVQVIIAPMMGLLMVLKDILKLQHNDIQHKKFGFILNPKIGQHIRITN